MICYLRVFFLLLFGGTTFSASAYSDSLFNEFNRFSNKWLLITKTNRTQLQCENSQLIQTNLFKGLKPGLFICVSATFDDKSEFNKKDTPGDAYLRFAGIFSDVEKDSLCRIPGTRFITRFSADKCIVCRDAKTAEQGSKVIVSVTETADGKPVSSAESEGESFDEFKKYACGDQTVVLSYMESGTDESSLHIIIWNTSGKLVYSDEFENYVDESESELNSCYIDNSKFHVRTVKKSPETEETVIQFWDGAKFSKKEQK